MRPSQHGERRRKPPSLRHLLATCLPRAVCAAQESVKTLQADKAKLEADKKALEADKAKLAQEKQQLEGERAQLLAAKTQLDGAVKEARQQAEAQAAEASQAKAAAAAATAAATVAAAAAAADAKEQLAQQVTGNGPQMARTSASFSYVHHETPCEGLHAVPCATR